ncbi:MAG TPA: hypothetical protein VMW24_24945 [Sedimentisphaerales bacterium]|nr:hypothetical protein [Sedimentisphaerales bacterium]
MTETEIRLAQIQSLMLDVMTTVMLSWPGCSRGAELIEAKKEIDGMLMEKHEEVLESAKFHPKGVIIGVLISLAIQALIWGCYYAFWR